MKKNKKYKGFDVEAIRNDFPILHTKVYDKTLIYFDNASTSQKPKVVIFDEPTRGVDVGAIKEIHDFIKSLADEGITVIVVSSYLPEVMSISDRILVARLGQIVEEFEIEDASEEKIIYAAVH